MEKEIIFRLSRPYKISRTASVAKVVLPAVDGDITILPDRAPTLILLRDGLIQILDKANNPVERYFVKGGIADVARNRCAVSTEKLAIFDNISIERAAEKREQAVHPDEKSFYQMIVDTLQLMHRK